MNRLPLLAATLLILVVILISDRALAQVQDAYVEKTYCVDERGNEISFVYKQGKFPPEGEGGRGSASIEGDERLLFEFSFLSQQFLFTRACLEAANLNLGNSRSANLECATSRFMMRRFKTRPSEIFEIVAELGNRDKTERIARSLSGC